MKKTFKAALLTIILISCKKETPTLPVVDIKPIGVQIEAVYQDSTRITTTWRY
jgi:hypothetical protein